jgi:hypothetical protein
MPPMQEGQACGRQHHRRNLCHGYRGCVSRRVLVRSPGDACTQPPLGASDPRTAHELPPRPYRRASARQLRPWPGGGHEDQLKLDGVLVGQLDEFGVNQIRDALTTVRPAAVTFGATPFLATDYDEYLLRMEDYDPDAMSSS